MNLQELEKQISTKFQLFFIMQSVHLLSKKTSASELTNTVLQASIEDAKEIIELFNELDDGTITNLKSVH